MLINYLIKEIVVYENAIHIYYKNPLNISPDGSQGFCFLETEKNGFEIKMVI